MITIKSKHEIEGMKKSGEILSLAHFLQSGIILVAFLGFSNQGKKFTLHVKILLTHLKRIKLRATLFHRLLPHHQDYDQNFSTVRHPNPA